MIALAELLDERWQDVEYDLLGLGLDLVADLGSDRLTWGRLGRVLARLDAQSATARGYLGREAAEWSLDRQLSASALDRLGVIAYYLGALIAQNGDGRNPAPEPQPVPRPGIEPKAKTTGTGMRSLAAKMGALPGRTPERPPVRLT